MDAGGWVAVITSIVALIGAVATWLKTRGETKVQDSDVAAQYQDMVYKSAKREAEIKEAADLREAKLMGKVDSLTKRVDALEAQLHEAVEYAERMERWARMLVIQLRNLGVTPADLPEKTNVE